MKNIFSSLRAFLGFFKYGSRTKPGRDWLVLLGIFAVMLGGSLAWNLWLFSQVTQGQKIGMVTATPPVEIRLNQVKTLFGQRAQEQGRYIGEYRFVDPSL